MKIGIDISQIIYGTGVSRYTRNLVSSLLNIDKTNEYVLFGGSLRRYGELRSEANNLGSNNISSIFPIPPTLADVLWNRLHIVPIEFFTGKLDVFHSSDWVQPPSSAFKVTTVHDLVPILQPDLAARDMIRNVAKTHRRRLFWVKKEANRIIVPSEATKVDLVELGFNEDKIRVVPEAPDPIFQPAKSVKIERLKRKYKIRGKYLLSIGVNPRKNTKRVIRAFKKVQKHKSYKDLSLLIIGHPYMKLERTAGVKILGYVSEAEMPVFYSGAEALVYPSIYEGFGLPILEAFSCKTPVVTSNLGSLKEVAGEAAILVEAEDSDSIREGIKKALASSEKLIEKGVKRVKNYTWERTAKATLKIYAKAN